MKIAYFPGCKIPFYLDAYGISFEALMKKLDVELVRLPFNCCGYPVRKENILVSYFSAIRNYALAQEHGLDILTPCKCCFGQFRHASYHWHQNKKVRQKMDSLLSEERLAWEGKTRVKHLLTFLYNDIGIENIKKRVVKKQREKKIVVQYGCQALRPFSITGFDNPHAPKIFEELIDASGFTILPWSKSTECCGNPIDKTNESLCLKIADARLKSAGETGADYICTACTHCQIQYNTVDFHLGREKYNIRPVLFTDLLGEAIA